VKIDISTGIKVKSFFSTGRKFPILKDWQAGLPDGLVSDPNLIFG
jgi:hypothetical protein